MKRTILFSAAVFALAMLSSCQKPQTPSQTEGVTEFTATIDNTAKRNTKTSITIEGNVGKIEWCKDDEITVTDGAGAKAVYVAQSSGPRTSFQIKAGETPLGAGPYTAAYGDINRQIYSAVGANCPLAATSATTEFQFKCELAILKITASSSVAKTVTFVKAGNSTLDCGSGVDLSSGAKDFYIAVAPGTYSNLEVSFHEGLSMAKKSRTSSVELKANDLLPITFNLESWVAGTMNLALSPFKDCSMSDVSENLFYVTGLCYSPWYPTIWYINTDKVRYYQDDCVTFRSVNNSGVVAGVRTRYYPDQALVYDGKNISLLPLYEKSTISPADTNKWSQAVSISEDGVIAGYCYLQKEIGTNYFNVSTPGHWINKEFKPLPVPTKDETGTGFEYVNCPVQCMSKDGSVTVGYVEDTLRSAGLVYWKKEGDSYKCEVACKPYFRPRAVGGKDYCDFKPYCVSANGEWVGLSVQKSDESDKRIARFNTRTNTLEVGDVLKTYYEWGFEYVVPNGISNDGTCVCGKYIWMVGSTIVKEFSELAPDLAAYGDYECNWIAGDRFVVMGRYRDSSGEKCFIAK